MRKTFGCGVLELLQGDLTEQSVDAVVNAANTHLAGGGGVDGAIHRRGGPTIMDECRKIGGCPTGQTVMTTGGNLPARFVLHTVGPVWRGGQNGEAELLASCYRSALTLSRDHSLKSIAFASISTGVYGYPVEKAASVALSTIAAFMKENPLPNLVRMVLFDAGILASYEKTLNALL
jgi:O-acetyl-ADP-ribose deacetylase (regulator of RNase III)